jgi:hypothetical protein
MLRPTTTGSSRLGGRRGGTAWPDAAGCFGLNFTTYVEKTRATTDSAGRFVITNNDSHNIRLAAEKPGVGRSARVPVRLYFRAQDIELNEPLILSGAS